MSAYFSHNSGNGHEWLAGTITTGAPGYTANKLITAWVKWENIGSVGGFAVSLFCTSDDALLELGASGSSGRGRYKYVVTGAQAINRPGFLPDTWYLIAAYFEGSDGSFVDRYTYVDGSGQGSTVSTAGDTGSQDFDRIIIGNDTVPDQYSRWEGWVEDVAVWAVADRTQAETIVSEIYNGGSGKRADNIAEKSPDYYLPLMGDSSVSIGAGALSQQGGGTGPHSVTFDALETPGLMAAGGGGVSTVRHVGHFV